MDSSRPVNINPVNINSLEFINRISDLHQYYIDKCGHDVESGCVNCHKVREWIRMNNEFVAAGKYDEASFEALWTMIEYMLQTIPNQN